MVSVKIQHNVIKKAQAKEHFTLSLSGLFSYPKDNPSSKRVARCTNIPHTGALSTVKGVGQRLRKGFQGQRVARIRLFIEQKQRDAEEIRRPKTRAKRASLNTTLLSMLKKLCLFFESLSSAAEIRHLARNTKL
jgi:hypothetical protein